MSIYRQLPISTCVRNFYFTTKREITISTSSRNAFYGLPMRSFFIPASVKCPFRQISWQKYHSYRCRCYWAMCTRQEIQWCQFLQIPEWGRNIMWSKSPTLFRHLMNVSFDISFRLVSSSCVPWCSSDGGMLHHPHPYFYPIRWCRHRHHHRHGRYL